MATLLFANFYASAQVDIQVQYDFGENRKFITTTMEMFNVDKWGNTFFYVDINSRPLCDGSSNGSISAYTEIARAINFWQDTKLAPLSLQVEYYTGLSLEKGANNYFNQGYAISDSWVFGLNYFLQSKNGNNDLTLKALYKNTRNDSTSLPLQFCAIWNCNNLFTVKGLSFNGFACFRLEDKSYLSPENIKKESSTFFITEPQLWYNIGRFFNCDNLNIGGEVEITNNLLSAASGWMVNPCLGVKWIF